MCDIFISYSSEDRGTVAELVHFLKFVRGYDVWWDRSILSGDSFHDLIQEKLDSAKAVIVVWSETAIKSNWVRGEAQTALDQGKLIVAYVDSFDRSRVPINFRSLHAEPVSHRSELLKALNKHFVTPGKPITATMITLMRGAAEEGDTSAHVCLGKLHLEGRYLERNYEEAARRFRVAAQEDDSAGQFFLGCLNLSGQGVDLDYDEGMRWLLKAEQQGEDHAGVLLDLVRLGYTRANEAFQVGDRAKQAASVLYFAGDLGIYFVIAYMASHNRGGVHTEPLVRVKPDYPVAEKEDLAEAQLALGVLYLKGEISAKEDEGIGIQAIRQSAESGLAGAQYLLACLHEAGDGVKLDFEEAFRLHRLAAEQDFSPALRSLGRMYEDGRGVQKDISQATQIYRIAADKGDEEAQELLTGLQYEPPKTGN